MAPLEAFQPKVGLVETPLAPSTGEARIGGPGAAITVVKVNGAEKELAPPAFVALTRQKY